MSGVTLGFVYWWNIIKIVLNIGEFNVTGSITLGPGNQEILIDTSFPNPTSIFLSCTEPDNNGITTCMGNLNWFAARPLSRGFVLYAEIVTDTCKIDYIVKYDASTPIEQGNLPNF